MASKDKEKAFIECCYTKGNSGKERNDPNGEVHGGSVPTEEKAEDEKSDGNMVDSRKADEKGGINENAKVNDE